MIIVFVCVANSARSQMAEGLARRSAPEGVDVYSAGSDPGTLNPYAVRALAELNIDISGHTSKGFGDVPMNNADLVIPLCAEENCPVLPSTVNKISWAMQDPASQGTDDESKLQAFRVARDEIAGHLETLWREIESRASSA